MSENVKEGLIAAAIALVVVIAVTGFLVLYKRVVNRPSAPSLVKAAPRTTRPTPVKGSGTRPVPLPETAVVGRTAEEQEKLDAAATGHRRPRSGIHEPLGFVHYGDGGSGNDA